MDRDGVLHRGLENFVFAAFKSERATALAWIVATIDGFSLRIRHSRFLSKPVRIFWICLKASLSRRTTGSQLLRLRDLICDRFRSFRIRRQQRQKLLPVVDRLLIIVSFESRA